MNKKMPKISIIVPVYNVENALRRCVESILSQTFTDFELLLIDDGSTDISGEICDEYALKDARVKVFHQNNAGASIARNIGLDHAKGEYICFCDSDDYVDNGWLNNFMDTEKESDMVVQAFFQVENSQIHKIEIPSLRGYKNSIILLDKLNVLGYLWCKCFRSSIISQYQLRFNSNYCIWEDTDFILRYALHCKSIYSTSLGGYYYNVPNWVKYEKYLNFDCCASILKSIFLIFGHDSVACSLYGRYEGSLGANLLKYYERGFYRVGYTKMCEYKRIIKECGNHTNNKLTGMILINVLITHVCCILKQKNNKI